MAVEIERLEQSLPVSDYGKGKAKSFQHLLAEVADGEAQIIWRDNRPIRLLRIVVLRVYCRDKTLVEDRQEFPDGRIRYRGIEGLSEKLYPQESHKEAVYRAMQEELGLLPGELQNVSVQFLGQELEKKESPSYPGLKSHYDKYKYEVHLPDSLYKPKYIEFCDDGMQTHFVWKKIPIQAA